jgi:mannose-6-phosphate isomerase-like protein (cupin superfamily)
MSASGLVGPGEGDLHELGGITARTLLPGSATGGRFSVVEHRLQRRELAAPMHLHHREDEYSIVTHGRVGFVLGDEVSEAGPGDFVRKPRDQWHTFFNPGDEEARLLEVISPAGFEDYFTELAAFFPADAPPDLDGMIDATGRYGLEMDFESLDRLVRRFDLAPPPEMPPEAT